MTKVDAAADTVTSDTTVASGERGAAPAVAIGARLGDRYVVRAFLGEGGMGAVYRALDEKLDEEVALKIVRGAFATSALLRDEVRLAQKVTHPNVCRTYDLEDVDGLHVVKMELVAGESLAALLARAGRLPIDRAVAIARQIAAGLAAAHAQGIVHRDLKPANVMIAGERAVLMDFGLAQRISAESDVAGTPGYMAPEQLAGAEVDDATDLYALGCVLHEMLAGERVFTGSLIELAAKHASTPAPDVRGSRSEVPRWLASAVARLLAKRAADRPAGLQALLHGPRRRVVPVVVAACAVVAGAVAVLAWPRGEWHADILNLPQFNELASQQVFSPDGGDLAYYSNRDGTDRIRIRHLADGTERVIPGTWLEEIGWARDGSALLLVGKNYHAHRVPLAGGVPQDLGPADSVAACGDGYLFRVWSWDGLRFEISTPTGRTVVFRTAPGLVGVSPRCDRTGAHMIVGMGESFAATCAADVSIVDRADLAVRPFTTGHDTCSATFSADGTSVIYAARRGRHVQLYERALAGGPEHRITTDDDADEFPDAASSGELAFTRVHAETKLTLGRPGAEPATLPVAAAVFDTMVPTPDGERLIAMRSTEDGVALVVIDIASGAERVLARDAWPFLSVKPHALYRTLGEPDRLYAAPLDGGPPTEVARLPGDVIFAYETADQVFALVATPHGRKSFAVTGTGTPVEYGTDGLVIPSPTYGWRLIVRFGDNLENTIALGAASTAPGAARPVATTAGFFAGWVDDMHFWYAQEDGFAIASVDGQVTTIRAHDALPCGVMAAGGTRWFTHEDIDHGSHHIIRNFAARPWR